MTRFAFALGLLLSLCTLQLGLAVDDWAQVLRVRGVIKDLGGPWDLYRFSGVDEAEMKRLIFDGPYPWWTRTDIRAGFFRPLSTALIHFDVKVIGDHVAVWHLHSIAWYLALLALLLAFYRRVLPPAAAPLALLFYAIDDAHWMPVGWLANRNSLVSSVPAMAGVLLHLRWREDGWKPGAPLSALAYAAALCGGESALGTLGFVGLYEVMNVRGEALKRRALSLLPLGLVFIAWAVTYRALGYGARGSAIYIDPVAEPLEYLAVAPGRFCALLGSLTLSVTSDIWMFLSKGRLVLAAGGLLGGTLFALFIRRARRHWSDAEWVRIRWVLASGLLALLPVISTFPADRLLLVPSMASAAIVAVVLQALWRETGALPRLARGLLIYTQAIAPLPPWVVSPYFLNMAAEYTENGVMGTAVSDQAFSGHVVFFSPPDPIIAMYGWTPRGMTGLSVPKHWHFLSYTPHAHRLKRIGENTVELEVIDGTMLESVMEQLFRAPRFPMDPGFNVKLNGLDVTVLASIEGRPTKLRVDFTQPLSELTFVQWKDARVSPLTLPEVGSEVVLEHEIGPLDKLSGFLGG